MLNLNQLRAFYHTARRLSVTRAARDMCITQPAVTAQIKAFEAGTELKFFRKQGRRIHLTGEGQMVYEYAVELFEIEKKIENAIEEMRELKRGVLRVGTTKTYARYFMPSLISSFHRSYPHIKINLDEGSSLDMINSLLEFENEVAVVAQASENPRIAFVPFSQEELVVILAPEHRLAGSRHIDFRQLAEEPFIMKEAGSGTRKVVNDLFRRHGCKPNVLMETGNNEFIKQLVHRAEGVSILVRACVALELDRGVLATVALSGQSLLLDVSLARLKGQPLSPAARAFDDMLAQLYSRDAPPQDIGSLMARILAGQSVSQKEQRGKGTKTQRDGG
jgi:DNA-binding transcriptional LysR family regulator